jgi:GAF domain-containing protein
MAPFHDDKLTEALVALSGLLFTQRTLHDDLERLVRFAAHSIPKTSGVSISMLVDGGAATIATTDRVTLELDLVQYDNSDGPCLAALGGPIVRLGYIPADERFPHFAIGAADRRVLSSLSIPIRHDGAIVGSLNLYSHRENGFDAAAEDTALVFAAEAALAIVHSSLFEQAHRIRASLQDAHEQSSAVSRAQGVLMGIHQISAIQAEALVQSAADSNGERLVEAAQRILDAAADLDTDHHDKT